MRKHSIYHFSTVVKEKTPDERLKQEIKKSQKQWWHHIALKDECAPQASV